MKKLMLLTWLIFPLLSNCQQLQGAQYKGADGIQHDFIIYNGKGEPIPVGDHSNIEGSPFLQNQWAFGMVKLTNGNVISDSAINYSLYNDKLFFKRNGNMYPVNYPVKEFSIQSAEDSVALKTYHFINGFPGIGRNDSSTFYEVLYEGNLLTLLRWQHKKIRETTKYNGPFESEYFPVQEYFIFYPKENRMVSLGGKANVNTVKKKLPHFSDQIKVYLSANKPDAGKDSSLIQLFSFLDAAKP